MLYHLNDGDGGENVWNIYFETPAKSSSRKQYFFKNLKLVKLQKEKRRVINPPL